MAQEVQTTLNYQAELNLIEWVWHQENKVREHTQVEQAFGYQCSVSWAVWLSASASERQSPTLQSTLWIWNMEWPTEFKIVNGWLRVPLAWAYMAHMEFAWGSSSMDVTHYVKIDGETIVQVMTAAPNSYTVIEKVINLWRYNVIEHRASMYFKSTWSAGTTAYFNLTLKKL